MSRKEASDLNIQEQFLHTTLRIELLEKGIVKGTGTGFLVSVPADGGKAVKIVLVSNKHVLLRGDEIAITFTSMKNGMPSYGNSIKLPISNMKANTVGHPDPDVDVAVIICTGIFNIYPDQLYFKAISYDMLSDFSEQDLAVAENVFFVGYPDGRFDTKNNLPLIRTGLISSNPRLDYNGKPQFVIDAQVFPGSSGSPVYINYTFENFKNGQIVLGNKQDIKVIGIIAKTMLRNNILQTVPVGTINYTQEVLGLGIVFKSTVIRETIDFALEKFKD